MPVYEFILFLNWHVINENVLLCIQKTSKCNKSVNEICSSFKQDLATCFYLAEVMCKLSSEPALLHLLSEAADSTTLGFRLAGCCWGGICRG